MKRLSESLQDLLLEYINGKREFSIDCKEVEKVRKLFLALGREIEVRKEKEKCFIMVYSRVS